MHKGSLKKKKTNQREVIQKLRKGELLDLIYITLKFGQNIPMFT